jgi:hypothetical protein
MLQLLDEWSTVQKLNGIQVPDQPLKSFAGAIQKQFKN